MQAYQKALNEANAEKQRLEAMKRQTFQQIQQITQREKQALDQSCALLLQKQRHTDQLLQKINENQLKLQKQALAWTELIQRFNQALKELGDAGQIASVIANDLRQISGPGE